MKLINSHYSQNIKTILFPPPFSLFFISFSLLLSRLDSSFSPKQGVSPVFFSTEPYTPPRPPAPYIDPLIISASKHVERRGKRTRYVRRMLGISNPEESWSAGDAWDDCSQMLELGKSCRRAPIRKENGVIAGVPVRLQTAGSVELAAGFREVDVRNELGCGRRRSRLADLGRKEMLQDELEEPGALGGAEEEGGRIRGVIRWEPVSDARNGSAEAGMQAEKEAEEREARCTAWKIAWRVSQATSSRPLFIA